MARSDARCVLDEQLPLIQPRTYAVVHSSGGLGGDGDMAIVFSTLLSLRFCSFSPTLFIFIIFNFLEKNYPDLSQFFESKARITLPSTS